MELTLKLCPEVKTHAGPYLGLYSLVSRFQGDLNSELLTFHFIEWNLLETAFATGKWTGSLCYYININTYLYKNVFANHLIT